MKGLNSRQAQYLLTGSLLFMQAFASGCFNASMEWAASKDGKEKTSSETLPLTGEQPTPPSSAPQARALSGTFTYSSSLSSYTKELTIDHNTPTLQASSQVSFSISPALPAGLILNSNTGVISGAPAATSSTTQYTVTATHTDSSTATSLIQVGVRASWAWVKGRQTPGSAGEYGIQGIAASINSPGAREFMGGAADSSGVFWMFGGIGRDSNGNLGNLGDLWKFNGQDWVWVTGPNTKDPSGIYGTKHVESSGSRPGGRRVGASWVDQNGNFWIFGGFGVISGLTGYLNDLWRYRPSTGRWTWVAGDNTLNAPTVSGTRGVASPSNTPGARLQATTWIDRNGNLWLMGGHANSGAQMYNDLWKFDVVSENWTWISGNIAPNSASSFGTLGVADASNLPRRRSGAYSWVDAEGNLAMYGGWTNIGSNGELGDYWKFNISSGLWTWVGGVQTVNAVPVFGTKGIAAPINYPGGRDSGLSWVDDQGQFWLYGGTRRDLFANQYRETNDVWKLDPLTGLWTWVAGSNQFESNGIFGTQGLPSADNQAGARQWTSGWYFSGAFWIFGGKNHESSGGVLLNDLWKFSY